MACWFLNHLSEQLTMVLMSNICERLCTEFNFSFSVVLSTKNTPINSNSILFDVYTFIHWSLVAKLLYNIKCISFITIPNFSAAFQDKGMIPFMSIYNYSIFRWSVGKDIHVVSNAVPMCFGFRFVIYFTTIIFSVIYISNENFIFRDCTYIKINSITNQFTEIKK